MQKRRQLKMERIKVQEFKKSLKMTGGIIVALWEDSVSLFCYA